ncbi:uncharacterized protein PFL1_03364 [Pseudozyma flocculosa PF-1]|uniref:Major facilitator superfamily (MFS) profile domain-containing protein n=1 Tax=Pseudozyma flocculosa PF-1 TaxID=1277687 RepID=A0A061HAN4_9BASI|nr:uncharacterized protein PFL1_03364 [Pseudozyma flocculosa PF-1]EPQ29075.1 hypothetical protein PFL1_03364 [Pseudozyma flocculosa PF-1]
MSADPMRDEIPLSPLSGTATPHSVLDRIASSSGVTTPAEPDRDPVDLKRGAGGFDGDSIDGDGLDGYDVDSAEPARNYPELGKGYYTTTAEAERSDEASWAVWILAFCAALSGSIFGYDTGYISSVLVNIGDDLGRTLSSFDKELITSATALGALIGALGAGLLGDWLGRKAVIAIANVIFIAGAIIQAACHGLWVMIVGRLVVGLGVGIASMIVPLWIGELAPTHIRGRLVTVNVVFITLGQVIAYGVGAGFEKISGGWRYTVAGGAIPAIVQLISMLWLPESPRFDIRKGRVEKVARTFQRIFPHATYEECLLKAEVISANVEAARQQGSSVSLYQRLRNMLVVGSNRRPLLVACGLQALQQLCGFNTLMYYSATIFAAIGFSNPTAVSLIVSVTNFLATLVALKYIDIIGRRRIMLWTVPGMVLGLTFAAVCFHFLTMHTNNELDGAKYAGFVYPKSWSILLILAMIFYVASYGLGVGNVPWQQGELFGIESRAIGTSLATATNWGSNLLIGATYLSLMSAITPAGAFGFYAGLCALGWVACIFGFPDTRRLSLEEVQSIFNDSWGIKAAEELRAKKDQDAAVAANKRQQAAEQVLAASTAVERRPGAAATGVELSKGRPGAKARTAVGASPETPTYEREQPTAVKGTKDSSGVDLDDDDEKKTGSTDAPVAILTNDSASVWDQTPTAFDDPDVSAHTGSSLTPAWRPPSSGEQVVFNDGRMTGSSPAMPSQLPASAMVPPPPNDYSTTPARPGRDRSATTNSVYSTRSIRAPRISMEGNASPLAKMGIKGDALMLFVTCFASLGVFLFGYDQGVMSGILTGPYFKAYFNHPTAYEVGTLVASLELGALVTSLACGKLADIFGRKQTLFWGAVIFSVGGTIQTLTTGFNSMLVGRIVSGLGVGFLSMIVPTYQSEISPAEHRGKLSCIEFTGNIIGYASSVWIDYGSSFIESDISWRLPLSLQAVIGLTLALGSLLLPESPRWLLDRDRDEEGMRVLADLHGKGDPNDPKAKLEFREIKENVIYLRKQGDNSYARMWRQYKYRTLIAMSSQAFAQLNGINVISYYAPLVFESAGWIGRDALLMTGINGIIYVLATVPTWFLVDLWGRRAILMSGAVVCGIALGLCGWFLYLDASYTPQAVVGCVIVYNAFFGYSWGPIPWLFPPEIMPLAFRAKGASLSTATNWAFNYIVGEATPVLQETIKWRLYPMHAFFCACSFVVVYFGYPETAGVPLEEIGALFGDEGIVVPQDDEDEDEDEDDEEAQAGRHRRESTDGGAARPIRRSISSHPRMQSEEERAARAAATRVAADERRKSRTFFGLVSNTGFLGRLFGAGADVDRRGEYEQVRRDEH